MDEYYNAKRIALILAVQAEIEAMKVENTLRESANESLIYSGEAFNNKASELRNLAYAPNETL